MSKYYYKNSDGLEIKEGFKGDKKMLYSYDELSKEVLKWADEKDLLHPENADKQFMKFIEEVFEFKEAWDTYRCKEKTGYYADRDSTAYFTETALELGDIFVTLIILAEQLEINPMLCLQLAYHKIKVRKGKTINGTFVKEEDL